MCGLVVWFKSISTGSSDLNVYISIDFSYQTLHLSEFMNILNTVGVKLLKPQCQNTTIYLKRL